MAGFGRDGLRAALMAYGSALLTDHLHNDRKSGVAFEAVGGWSEASPATWNSTGLRVRYAWHNDWLRGKLPPGARIVRCTLAPATDSSNGWATVAGQTGRNDDSTWTADYATGAGGDQFKLADLIMRRGAYAVLAHGGPGECDAGFDLYAALGGTADGKWPAGGTGDGTHPSETLQTAAAADLAPRLPALLGFVAAEPARASRGRGLSLRVNGDPFPCLRPPLPGGALMRAPIDRLDSYLIATLAGVTGADRAVRLVGQVADPDRSRPSPAVLLRSRSCASASTAARFTSL